MWPFTGYMTIHKQDKICLTRTGFSHIETVSDVQPPFRDQGLSKIVITTAGEYRTGERFLLQSGGCSQEVIVEGSEPVANRDLKRVVLRFTNSQ